MKEYRPVPKISLPRWLETIIQCGIFLFSVYIIHLIGLDTIVFNGYIFSSNLDNVIFTILLYYSYKVLGTFTAVDLVAIDYGNCKITFEYWLFYFYKRSLSITFEDLSYKNRNDILILGGSLGLYIYKGKKLKIKINKRNGWKNEQIDSLTKELLIIKTPLRPLVERPF